MTLTTRLVLPPAVAAACALTAAVPAAAGSTLVVHGAGYGHGVGMSQYGAYGMALRGWDHRRILRHYYTGTALGTIRRGARIRVLLGASTTVRFTRATSAGDRRLQPRRQYGARARSDGRVDLLSPTGRRLKTVPAPLRVRGSEPVEVRRRGRFRGTVELRPDGRRLLIVNRVAVEDYVRGVVALESPATWPAAALEAQAIAARTYALTTAKAVSPHWDHYDDTRSQVYGGVAAETASTDRAVRRTRRRVVTYGGVPAVTYFFSTSGGRTEDVEHGLGGPAHPWLRSVADPYDDVSPRHRWTIELSFEQAGKRLGDLVRGDLVGIEVLRRGTSPRILEAEVVGTEGRVRVTGPELRARLELPDTWAAFTVRDTQ